MISPRLGSRSRLAAIAAIPVMGATLLFVVWSTVQGIRAASATTMRGEAAALHATLLSSLFEGDEGPEQRLPAATAEHRQAGLHSAALIRDDGSAAAIAGDPVDAAELGRWALGAEPGEPERHGDLARVVYRPRLKRVPPDRKPPPAIVLVFEPRVADELVGTARPLLVVGVLAALALTGLAGLLVRWSLGRERAVRAAEQERRLATLGQVSAVLAHEIRNPLASLKGNAQLLAMSMPEGEKSRAKADRVVTEATRLEALSNDLLSFARQGEVRIADVDPVALARDAADAVAADRIAIEADGAPRSWPLDRDKIRSVLVNLLENAAEMSEGPITVRLGRDGRGRDLTVAVRDRGPGIADADLPQVFEPFFTRRERGTGLGLAVARRLVELHGGTIRAGNAPDGGAELSFALPRQK